MNNIPLDKLRPSQNALRSVDRASEEYADLVSSIQSQGVLHPILVRPLEGGLFEVVDGHHRAFAAQDAGLSEVLCEVRALNDDEASDLSIIANAHRIPTSPCAYAKAVQAMAARGATLQQIAARLGKSLGWLANTLSLLKLEKHLAEQTDAGRINLGNATWLTKLSVDDQLKFADQAREQPTSAFSELVKAHLRELREARDAKPFTPKPRPRSLAAIKAEYEQPDALAHIDRDVCREVLAWCLNLDPDSIAEARAAWEKSKSKARELATA
jgi:ParB family chromosome partitioning protein